MSFREGDIHHPGLRRLWLSGGLDNTGISIAWANMLRSAMAHVDTARSIRDLRSRCADELQLQRIPKQPHRYRFKINRFWQLAFDCDDPHTGRITHIDIEAIVKRRSPKK